jgi:oligopeptide transport system substrate-binding protein
VIRTKIFNTILMSASALALASCGANDAADSDRVLLNRGNNAEPLSLDPHKASGTWENNIIGDMFLGLFTDDPDGAPIPGMAESWDVSEDGLTWTFTLREATWSDGEPVKASDFVFAWQRIATPTTGAQMSPCFIRLPVSKKPQPERPIRRQSASVPLMTARWKSSWSIRRPTCRAC